MREFFPQVSRSFRYSSGTSETTRNPKKYFSDFAKHQKITTVSMRAYMYTPLGFEMAWSSKLVRKLTNPMFSFVFSMQNSLYAVQIPDTSMIEVFADNNSYLGPVHGAGWFSQLFPILRRRLQKCFLAGVNLMCVQCSIYVPVGISVKNL